RTRSIGTMRPIDLPVWRLRITRLLGRSLSGPHEEPFYCMTQLFTLPASTNTLLAVGFRSRRRWPVIADTRVAYTANILKIWWRRLSGGIPRKDARPPELEQLTRLPALHWRQDIGAVRFSAVLIVPPARNG